MLHTFKNVPSDIGPVDIDFDFDTNNISIITCNDATGPHKKFVLPMSLIDTLSEQLTDLRDFRKNNGF